MGWTTTFWYAGKTIEGFFAEEFRVSSENADKVRYTVLETALVRRTEAYAAIEMWDKIKDTHETFAAVYKVLWCNSTQYNFSYKGMTEFSGPTIQSCPEKILKLLTPIKKPDDKESSNQWAREWRAKCWKNLRLRKQCTRSHRKEDLINIIKHEGNCNDIHLKFGGCTACTISRSCKPIRCIGHENKVKYALIKKLALTKYNKEFRSKTDKEQLTLALMSE